MFHLVVILSVAKAASALIDYSLAAKFLQREHVNTLILFGCDLLDSSKLYREFSESFPGSIHMFDIDSTRFYNDHRRFMEVTHFRLAVVTDLSCVNSYELLNFCSINSYFNGSYRWLMFAKDSLDVTVNFLRTQNLNIDSSVTVAVPTIDEGKCDIYEVYGTIHRRGGKVHAIKVGENDQQAVWTRTTKAYNVRNNLEGVTLISVVAVRLRFLYVNRCMRRIPFCRFLGLV